MFGIKLNNKMSKTKLPGAAMAENTGDVYKTIVRTENDVFTVDEPEEFGGKAAGPSPVDYLCMSLASCKAITIRMYANRKQWQIKKIDVKVTFVKATKRL